MEVIKSAVISKTYSLVELSAILASLLARAPFAGPATATLHGKRAGARAWVAVAALRALRRPKMKEVWVKFLVPHLRKYCASFDNEKQAKKACASFGPPLCLTSICE